MAYPKLRKYNITRKVCRRFCYTLYEAEDAHSGLKNFVKVLHRALANDRSYVFNFLKGGRLSRMLSSRHIPNIRYCGKDHESLVIALEYYDEKPLSLFLHEEFPVPFQRVIEIAGGISRILRQAHLKGVVHGALNPTCVFIDDQDELKVDDFGYHWLAPCLYELEDAEALYLSYHIAPEVYKGEEIDGRADIYSLGVILLQLLTDYLPFNSLDPMTIPNQRLNISLAAIRKLLPHYPKRIEKILARALQPNPEQRFQNLKHFEDQLEKLKREYSYETELSHLEKEWLQPGDDR